MYRLLLLGTWYEHECIWTIAVLECSRGCYFPTAVLDHTASPHHCASLHVVVVVAVVVVLTLTRIIKSVVTGSSHSYTSSERQNEASSSSCTQHIYTTYLIPGTRYARGGYPRRYLVIVVLADHQQSPSITVYLSHTFLAFRLDWTPPAGKSI